jgi:hypothetical protein
VGDENNIDSFDDLFEPFELEDGPPPTSETPPAPRSSPVSERPDAGPDPDHEHVSMVSCPSCGTANPAFNRHCEACGARLSTAPLPVAPPPMVRATPGSRALGVLLAVVLIATLIAVFMNIFGGDEEPTPDTSTTLAPTTVPPVAIDELQPSTVEASSELGTQWVAENLIDGNLATEWQDRSLSGRGAILTFRFSQPVAITEIEMYNLPDDERFKQNHRIRGYRITVDDLSYEITGQLANVNTRQVIQVASISTRTLTFEVTSTYESEPVDGGVPFTELALADVRFFGRLAN